MHLPTITRLTANLLPSRNGFCFFCFLFFILSCGEVHIHAFDPQNIIMIYSRHVFQLLIYGKIIFEPSILFPTGFLLKHVTLTCVIMIHITIVYRTNACFRCRWTTLWTSVLQNGSVVTTINFR